MYEKVKDRCLIKNLLYIKFYFVIIHIIIIYASVKLNFKRNFIRSKSVRFRETAFVSIRVKNHLKIG